MVVVSGLESPVFFKHPSSHKPYFKCKEDNRSHRRKLREDAEPTKL